MVLEGLENAKIVFYGELIKIDTLSETYSFRIELNCSKEITIHQ